MSRIVNIVAIIGLIGLSLSASPTRPRIETVPAAPVTLMSIDQHGTLRVNNDDGNLMGTVTSDGKLKLAPHVSREQFFMDLISALQNGLPEGDDCTDQFNEMLKEFLRQHPVDTPPTVSPWRAMASNVH